ncbi:MAG: hypothetical protein CVT49_15890 [candidate division Zixibacteria bacterium HGW-Zixibacteria-1]|nr:MAG: hypothetical protein CVT49_15890 [candidate division Zixibacteria bacterium HGW-Zixibacteria-1]
MRRAVIFGLISCTLIMCGCLTVSLNPFYENKDLVFEQSLLGTWAEKDGDTHVVFEMAGEKAYIMTNIEYEQESRFEAHLFRSGGELFLDLYPRDPGVNINDLYRDHLIGVHSFYRVHQIEPMLVVSTIEYDWLKKYLSENPGELSSVMAGDKLVLTASPADLQAFILKHLKSEGAFCEPAEFYRIEKD